MMHLSQLPVDTPRFECRRGSNVKPMLTLTQPASFWQELLCNLVLNESYIDLSFPLAFILLGVLQLCLWHCVQDKELLNKKTRGFVSMDTELIMLKSTFWQLSVRLNVKLHFKFYLYLKARAEFLESVILSVVKFSIATYSCKGCTLHKVTVCHAS